MDTIFRHFIQHEDGEQKRKAYTSWFVDTFPSLEFTGDELVFYEFMHYCTVLNAPLCLKYLDVFLSTELRKLLVEYNIHVVGTEALMYSDPTALESAVRITTEVLRDDYKSLEMLEENINDFIVDIREYMGRRLKERLIQTMSDAFNTMQNTDDPFSVKDSVQSKLSLVADTYDLSNLEILVDSPIEDSKAYKICEFGLPAIDRDSDGIWSRQLIGIEAQPGTGKTRFALNLCYNAAVYEKRSAMFISLEQSREELEAMLVSKHVYTLYSEVVWDSAILHNDVPAEMQTKVTAAKMDLFESGKYGKLGLISTDLEVETFINKIKNFDASRGPFDIIAIDYMGLLGTTSENYKREKTLYEIVKNGFRMFKRYVRLANKAGIAISQFNREGIDAGMKDHEITTDMAEGGIAVYKNTDFNIAMSMSPEMKRRGERRFSQPKVRGSQGFGSIIVTTSLGILLFSQKEQPNI